MDVNKISLRFVALMLNICGLCLCTLNPNKNKRINCNKENIQNCILSNDYLHCSNFNFSMEMIFPNDPLHTDETSELQTRHNKCYVSWKRKKAKIHRCAIVPENDVQKHNYNCNCRCIFRSNIQEINRRDVSETSSEEEKFNVSYYIAPIPQTGTVVVTLHVESQNSLILQIYGVKITKSGHCNGERIYNTSYNLSSLDVKTQQFEFRFNTPPGNYCLTLTAFDDQKYKSYFEHFEMEPAMNNLLPKASQMPESFPKDFVFYIILIPVVLLGILGIGFYLCYRRKNRTLPFSKEVQVGQNEIIAKSKPKVLIMYGSDIEGVKLFASVLENCLNCTVVGDWIIKEYQKIVENMVLWVTENVEVCDKIIVVNCKKTFDRQEQFLKHPNTNTPDTKHCDSYTYPIFDYFLIIAHSKLIQHQNKIFNIRFPGTSSDYTLKYIGIDSGGLEIPHQFPDLFIRLHNMNPKNAAENLDLELTKKASFKEFCSHLKIGNSSEEDESSTSEPQSPNSATTLINASFQFVNER